MKISLIILVMISVLTAVLAAPHHFIKRHYQPHRISRIHELASWKTIAAGGAAAGIVTVAYKISDGVEKGLKTVAKEKPEVFADILVPFAMPLRIIVLAGFIYAGYRIWRQYKIKQKTQKGIMKHEN